jgi:Flp pilus assembly protein TadG
MAIVAPLLLLLLLGIVDFGRLLQQQIQLTEAVREGARLGALGGTNTDVQAQVSQVVGAGITLTYTNLNVCSASSGVSADSTVTAKRAFAPATGVFTLMKLFGTAPSGTITLSATGVMGCVG